MIKVYLYGHLAKKFGKLHYLTIRTPAEAIRALEANFKGFKQAILDKKIAGYKVIVDKQDRSTKDELTYPVSNELKFIPIIQGSGGNGVLNIVLGIVLIVVAIVSFNYELISPGAALLLGAQGAMLIVAGVSAMLYKPPDMQTSKDVDQNKGTYFNGPTGMTRQGNPIPLAYGKVMVGSLTVHASISTVEQ